MVEARNVFDSEEEFTRLRGAMMSTIDGFAVSRGGNVTYGEIMFVLESIIDELSTHCKSPDSEGKRPSIEKMTRVSQIRGVMARALHLLTEKGIISNEEEVQLVSGA